MRRQFERHMKVRSTINTAIYAGEALAKYLTSFLVWSVECWLRKRIVPLTTLFLNCAQSREKSDKKFCGSVIYTGDNMANTEP